MGVILSTLRKKKSSLQELEEIEHTITTLEESSNNVEQRYRVVARLLFYIGTLVAAAVTVAAYFWPTKEFRVQFIIVLSFVFLVFLIIYLKKILNWYYNRQINCNRNKLFEIKQKEKKIIEDVMEKETYKVAKEILEKFAPDRVASNALVLSPRPNLAVNFPTKRVTGSATPLRPTSQPAINLNKWPLQNSKPTNALTAALPKDPLAGITTGLPSRVDPFLEYLIGDGPNNRYALICNSCHTHNGMVLKEEFPYIGFRCFECKTFNHPRMLRPAPLQLMDTAGNTSQDAVNDDPGEENIDHLEESGVTTDISESKGKESVADEDSGSTVSSAPTDECVGISSDVESVVLEEEFDLDPSLIGKKVKI